MPDQIMMPASTRKYMEEEMIGQNINGFAIQKILGIGNTAVTYEVEDEAGFKWALKFVTSKSYGERAPFREVARFSRIEDDRYLVFPKQVGDWNIKVGKSDEEFIWFKSRCVKGKTLDSFLKSNARYNSRIEIQRFLEQISVGLEELNKNGFAHGDLHNRNIMREVIGEDSALPEIRYVIIDFSEAYQVGNPNEGLRNDLECIGDHIESFSEDLFSREELSRDDKKVLAAIQHLPGLIRGVTAGSIGIAKPSDVLKRYQNNLYAEEESPRKLKTPFDALSAEDIKNNSLLIDLCFQKTWWADELEKSGNILLVGPRGCGKSMMFRRLRLKTKIIAKKDEEIKHDNFLGFYLPCESVFFNRISDLTDATVDKYREALILFFNMALTSEIISTLSIIPKYFGNINISLINKINKLVFEETSPLSDDIKIQKPITALEEICDYSEQTMRFIRRQISYGKPVEMHGTIDYLTRLVEIIKHELPLLSPKIFIFFIDDYTEERIPISLQRYLHPIICQRTSEISFKISAHMFGTIYSYPQSLALDEGRNIILINLGSEYLKRNRKRAEGKALIYIMNKRFKECDGYDGTIEEWLGKTLYPGGRSLNRSLHDKNLRKNVKYHGIECLLDLCTGDFSEMIRTIGEIFREAGISKGAKVHTINPSIQDKAIRNISRDFLSRIRNVRPDGQKLYDVVNSFGILSQKLLYEREEVGQGKDKKGKKRSDPYDLLTIYVDDLIKAKPSLRKFWERLQRASIFIDIRLAPSQRTVIADRVTLRRIYCPAFGTTLTSSEHLQLTKEQFEYFMLTPEEFCQDHLRKSLKKPEGVTFWEETKESKSDESDAESFIITNLPDEKDKVDLTSKIPNRINEIIDELPEIKHISEVINDQKSFDVFIGAMGFEERTSSALNILVSNGVTARRALIFEYDLYIKATEERRNNFEELTTRLCKGIPYRPINAPLSSPDPLLPERINNELDAIPDCEKPRILFDCTSCPSRVLSKCLRVLLTRPCDITILYSEAMEYFPTKTEWESGLLKPRGYKVEGPFTGIKFVEKPTILQSDDGAERPLLLVLYPTFNTERTNGVLVELDPAKRIWLFGEPHDLEKNTFRIDMAKSFAAPIMYPEDPWALISTFDYKKSLIALSNIYNQYQFDYRIAVIPHGSKAQTIGVSLFSIAHEISMIFAMPKEYNPKRYSSGCCDVWALHLGESEKLYSILTTHKVVGSIRNGEKKTERKD